MVMTEHAAVWTPCANAGSCRPRLERGALSGALVVVFAAVVLAIGTGSALAADVTLTVTKSGDGTGTVTSYPAGIDCGSTCSASFPSDASLIVEAKPSPGSYFLRWTLRRGEDWID